MSKEYSQSKAIGNAGAFLFGYKITSMYGWLVRFVDESTDLGVDAEIEITDPERRSIGKTIKVQIKSRDMKKHYISLSHDDVNYLESLDVPVIIVSVDISAPMGGIYWMPLSEGKQNPSSRTFNFSSENQLDGASKQKLLSLIQL
jgi:Domain of unknown function (DUF4365)